MKSIHIFLGLGLLLVSLGACKRQLPDYGGTAIPNVANRWFVNLNFQGSPIVGPIQFDTYNTSGNSDDSMWVDDLGSLDADFQGGDSSLYYSLGIGLASFKGTTGLQYMAETFSGSGIQNAYWTGDTSSSETFSVYNGIILPKASKQPSGAMADSIYFQIVFSKNPLDTFVIAGNNRTGFDQDDK
jgi:hypothetical protein